MAKLAIEAIKRVLTRHFSGLAVMISMIAWPHASPADDAAGRPLPADHAAGRYEYTNGLIDSNDPYLLLHAHNPVDWYPWGSEAFAKAKKKTNRSSSRLGTALATGVMLPNGRSIRIPTSPN